MVNGTRPARAGYPWRCHRRRRRGRRRSASILTSRRGARDWPTPRSRPAPPAPRRDRGPRPSPTPATVTRRGYAAQLQSGQPVQGRLHVGDHRQQEESGVGAPGTASAGWPGRHRAQVDQLDDLRRRRGRAGRGTRPAARWTGPPARSASRRRTARPSARRSPGRRARTAGSRPRRRRRWPSDVPPSRSAPPGLPFGPCPGLPHRRTDPCPSRP